MAGFSKDSHAGISAHAFALTYDLSQLVTQTTRVPDVGGQEPSLLELLLTSHAVNYDVLVRALLGTSDHCLVATTLPRPTPPMQAEVTCRVWHYSSADWDGMRDSVLWGQRCFRDTNLIACAEAIVVKLEIRMEYYIISSVITSNGTRRPWYG